MTSDRKSPRAKPSTKAAGGRKTQNKTKKKTPTRKAAGGPRRKAPRRGGAAAEVALPKRPPENPKAQALARKIAKLVLDKKGSDVLILDVRGIASYADYVVIASGESERQVTAMAENVMQKVKEEDGLIAIGSEGMETGQWVLLDYGDVVAHLFYSELRSHYDLEGLWADAARESVA